MSQPKALHQSGPLASRIKRMMQSDEDVGKVAKASPVLIAAAMDKFIDDMINGSLAIAESREAKIITSAHLKAHVMSQPLLDFCKGTVASAPDLLSPEAEAQAATGAKRPRPQRSQSAEARPKKGRGGAGGRGKGRSEAKDEDFVPETAGAIGGQVHAGAGNIQAALEASAVNSMDMAALLQAPGAEAEEDDYD